MVTIGKIIKSFRNDLKTFLNPNELFAIESLVFEHFLNFSSTDTVLKPEFEVPPEIIPKLEDVISRLKNHEPIQYILGKTFFYRLWFRVSPEVLIPRPETEELVDWVVTENNSAKNINILDIGTGSGCIAVSLAKFLKNSTVSAFDISESALEIARRNAMENNSNVEFMKYDIIKEGNSDYPQKFDIIVSNPPYVLEYEMNTMKKNVLDFEPGLALFVKDDDPLVFYRAIADFSQKNLNPGGKLYVEINEAFGNETTNIFRRAGFMDVALKKDINDKDRMIYAKKSNHG